MQKKQDSCRWIALAFWFLPAAMLPLGHPAFAQTRNGAREHWVATWATAAQQGGPSPIVIMGPDGKAISLPAAPPNEFNHQTIRMIVHTSIPGRRARIELSNVHGTTPVPVGAVHIALRAKESAIVPGSDHALTFSGKPTFTIPPGAVMVSDPVDIDVPQLGDLAVSLYLPSPTGVATIHSNGLHTTYIKDGDVTSQPNIADGAKRQSYYFLSRVDVMAPTSTSVMVGFGDSITDGSQSTPDTNSSWPSFLAKRLLSNPATSHISVLNEGIAANRVTRDGLGSAGLTRFDRDVLMQPGVKWVIILEGINDIGAGLGEKFVFGPRPNSPANMEATADDLIVAYRQMIERAHEHGVKVMVGTLTPFEGSGYYSEKGNAVRQAFNQWVRTSGAFDQVVDFDAISRDPANPNKYRAEYDSGDHLHPGNTGYKGMADAIDLSFFSGARMSAEMKKK